MSNEHWSSIAAGLDEWGDNAAPQHAFKPTIDSVTNGDYDCEFLNAKLDKINNGIIVRTELKIGGRSIEHVYWINKQAGVNSFLAEMLALGFSCASWGNGQSKTPLSKAIPDCVGKLKGVRFRATKSSRLVPAKEASYGQPAQEATTYHSLNISGRISGSPMPSHIPMTNDGTSPGGGRTDSIPF